MKKTILATILMSTMSLAMATGPGNSGNAPPFNQGGSSSESSATGVGIGVGIGGNSSSNATGGNAVAVGGSVNNSVKNNVDNTNVNSNVSSNKNSNVSKNTNSNSNASSNSNNSGASVNVEGDEYRAPATAFAPALTSGVCMGSASAALGTQVFSIGGGSTTIDEECQIRYNSIRLEQLGMRDAGVLIMCQVHTAKLALEQSGFMCPVKEEDQKPTKKNVGTGPVWEQ
jgi:hypothetical protein